MKFHTLNSICLHLWDGYSRWYTFSMVTKYVRHFLIQHVHIASSSLTLNFEIPEDICMFATPSCQVRLGCVAVLCSDHWRAGNVHVPLSTSSQVEIADFKFQAVDNIQRSQKKKKCQWLSKQLLVVLTITGTCHYGDFHLDINFMMS